MFKRGMRRMWRMVSASVLICVAGSLAETGMVLLKRLDDPASSTDGAIVLKYLSSGTELVLEDCCSKHAKFSPDGRTVAFSVRRAGLYTIDIDGRNRATFEGMGEVTQWCANGYLYRNGSRIREPFLYR